ncbi:hypothetical protein BCF55_1157 [Hydrogenivirga caldilitoris]|uniref:Uncharacterized protein n=1 Tax=Hydrogenivirga caldilitoris TaxID=246264 RepID=A0A497XRF7_9AQUI|nr:hypothetical protein [Hydrogenivirga caldilitoris]RLJ70871.1 hypothetical protein BCF55_1157 [Hydrogenivirga caldilitoris]
MKKIFLIPTALAVAFISGCGGGGGNSPAGVVTVEVANNGGSQVFFAYQDGAGAWQTASPTISGYKYTYQFNVTDASGKYGAVVFCTSNMNGNLFHGLISERNRLYVDCGTPTYTLSGSFNPQYVGVDKFVYWSTQYWQTTQSGSYAFNTPGVPPGTHDIITILEDGNSNDGNLDILNSHVVIDRNVSVTTNTVHNVDFTNAPTADSTSYTWSCGNTNTNSHRVSFLSAGGTTIYNIGGSSYQPLIPSSLFQNGDFWNYASTATSGSATTSFQEFHDQPSNYNCQGFPPHMTQGATFTVVDANLSTERIQVSWNAYSSGLNGHQTQVYKLNEYMFGGSYYWYIHWTIGWLGNNSSYTYTFPNLSSLTGWDDNWYPDNPSSAGKGDLVAYTSNKTTVDLLNLYFDGTAIDGMEYVTASINNP